MSDELTYPIGMFAPGDYSCLCAVCGKQFFGEKRAVQCEPCALRGALRTANHEIERLRSVAQTAFGLLWQDRHTEARLHLSAALTKEQKGDGIAAARSMDEVQYKDLPIPPPVAQAVEALEHAAKHYQWLSDDEGDTGWVKYQAAAVMLDHWAAGIGEEKK